jgi:sulfite reductase beta subunit-like hemoprotein
VRDHLAEQVADPLGFGPFHVKISGCPNSCGQHHIGDVGMTGMMVKDEHGVDHPHYSLLLGGGVGEGRTRIGKRLVGRYAEADAPRAIAALAGYYREHRQRDERFGEFVERVGVDALDAVARQAAVAEVK